MTPTSTPHKNNDGPDRHIRQRGNTNHHHHLPTPSTTKDDQKNNTVLSSSNPFLPSVRRRRRHRRYRWNSWTYDSSFHTSAEKNKRTYSSSVYLTTAIGFVTLLLLFSVLDRNEGSDGDGLGRRLRGGDTRNVHHPNAGYAGYTHVRTKVGDHSLPFLTKQHNYKNKNKKDTNKEHTPISKKKSSKLYGSVQTKIKGLKKLVIQKFHLPSNKRQHQQIPRPGISNGVEKDVPLSQFSRDQRHDQNHHRQQQNQHVVQNRTNVMVPTGDRMVRDGGSLSQPSTNPNTQNGIQRANNIRKSSSSFSSSSKNNNNNGIDTHNIQTTHTKPTTCSDGSPAILNDNYCDCVTDGTDEPQTSACSHITVEKTTFRCVDGDGMVFGSRVGDGVKDCKDGSDETVY